MDKELERIILTQSEYLLRIATATLCGAAIGYERESRMKTAGIRTHIIVAMAAALMMVVSKYGFGDIIGTRGIDLDPSRIAAGIVTAIGFLGAGIIFVRKQNVSGLTTAAGIWATVGVGMSIGAGLYFIGIAVAILIIVVQIFFHKKTKLLKEPMSELIVLEISNTENIKTLLSDLFVTRDIEIISMKAKKLEKENLEIKLYVKYPETYDIEDLIQLLKDIPHIKSIEI